MKTVAIAGTFDSKGEEFLYLKKMVQDFGVKTYTIHTGVFEPAFCPDVDHEEIAGAAGYDIEKIAETRDRALATEVMSRGLRILLPRLYQEGKFDGILSLGGSGGTAVVTPAMRELPIGVPKLMVSTMASGDVSKYVDTSDIIMMPSVVDVAGINSLSRMIYGNAAAAICGMVKNAGKPKKELSDKKTVAATMFGVTTPCVEKARLLLESYGYEVLIFHATGAGGRTMENLVKSGLFAGILDITTTEWCDEVVGGILSAGKHRSEAAALCGIPQVVSVGAMDMVNFGPPNTVPEKYKERNFYHHNPMITLMRTNVEENQEIAKRFSEKLKMASGNTALLLPEKGVSMLDAEGQPFYGPQEDAMLFGTLEQELKNSNVEIIRMECNINEDVFAAAAAEKLIAYMEGQKRNE